MKLKVLAVFVALAASLSVSGTASAAPPKITQDNASIDLGMKEAGQKAKAAMSAN
jgi:hypothetical protein